MEYEPVIGLEVHVQLNTKSKLFCSCSTEFGAEPNSNTCPICMGYPGVLPKLNYEALKKAIMVGIALNCKIAKYTKFDRKSYFYPDLPKGYQISQYDMPLNYEGYLEFESLDGSIKRVRIIRAHLEEDAGKLIHAENGNESYVDLNRAGTPLVEIVSYPDIFSVDEAYHYLQTLKNTMKYIGVSDVNMEEGSLRVDANISIRPKGSNKLGTKVEIKNMNSFNFLKKALEYEIKRQISILDKGEKIIQETRLFDPESGKTYTMRTKEEAEDYRYFPDPDLPPVVISDETVESIKKEIPELPYDKYKRFKSEYNLPSYDAQLLTEDKSLADYFEKVVKSFKGDPKKVSNWIMSEVMRYLNEEKIEISSFGVKPEHISELLNMVEDNKISIKIAKDIFPEMIKTLKSPSKIVEEKGLIQVSDASEIEKICKEVIQENPLETEKYRSGKTNVLGFLVGQVMKKTQGKANPKLVNEILTKLLSK
ncbi:MAG: Asp-tRNA(Asn)/Glu-tRNA(Gln) amidotransferase subunit GatB [Brevinematales bacterium]|nr:Asp-tRNA(Asn)/Glu-tRNA(Gln) amidotransferase subunit GatB [Brevinematales bacterium]